MKYLDSMGICGNCGNRTSEGDKGDLEGRFRCDAKNILLFDVQAGVNNCCHDECDNYEGKIRGYENG